MKRIAEDLGLHDVLKNEIHKLRNEWKREEKETVGRRMARTICRSEKSGWKRMRGMGIQTAIIGP